MSDAYPRRGDEGLRSENRLRVAALAFFIALSAIKMAAYAKEGRFWAEEGRHFFAPFSALSPWERVFHLFHGHLELLTNLVISAAFLVPMKYAPLVTTYLSFASQLIPVLLVVIYRRELGLGRWSTIALMCVIVGLPQSAEVWANAVNLHFHCALTAALIAAIDPTVVRWRWMFRPLLAMCGLSGVPANFVAPVFVWLALKTRDRERVWQCAILGATAVLQAMLLVTHAGAVGRRAISFDPRLVVSAIASQSLISPLFGFQIGDDLGKGLQGLLVNDAAAIPLAMACTLFMAGFALAIARAPCEARRIASVAAALLAVLGIVGSLGDKTMLVSAAVGGRYFFAANVLFAIAFLGLCSETRGRLMRGLACVLVVASALRLGHCFGGPPWRQSYRAAVAEHADMIDIWPWGWKMKNVAEE